MRRVLGTGLAATAALCLAAAVVPAASAQENLGTILGADRADVVKDSYIVSLKAGTASRAAAPDLAGRYGGTVRDVWQHALNGFSVTMTEKQAARLAADPRVAFVQQDAVVHALDVQQNPPSWGIDRIDQRDLSLSNSYEYRTNASNVTAYIIDTGVRTTHQTFGNRATWGTNTVDSNNTDCHGHGTHVAGTVAGAEYGVAKAAKVVAVKVLNCQGSGTTAGVVNGVNWVTQNAVKPAVANMSLGGGADAALDTAVRNSIAAGITYAIASGNSNTDACSSSPARVAEAITVNSSTNTDARSSFSNYGSCTDIFAPGSNIVSAWSTSDTATNNISGTSMATPHVAGAAALWLADHPTDSPAAVWAGLNAASTPNKITSPGNAQTPNKLLYTLWGSTQPGSPSVTNPGDQTSTVGSPVSLQLAATGGTPPYTWSVTGLPAGLSASASGAISGTPTTAGTSTVTATVTDSAGKTGSASFTWTVNAVGGGCEAKTNATAVPIGDLQTVTSTIAISGCAGNASATATIKVDINHTYKGDLVVDLVAPDGTVYNLHNRSGGSTDNIKETFTRDLSAELANGTWTLRVRDAALIDTGTLNSWTLDV